MAKRVAVVTGANRGIGKEIARELGADGVRVIVASRDPQSGASTVESLRGAGAEAEFFSLDVTRDEDVSRLAKHIGDTYGAADILINNAGVMLDASGTSLFDIEQRVFRDTFEVNFYGPLRLAQALTPAMRARNYGRIVNLASGLGQLADMGAGTPAYRISKTALNALTSILAAELAGTDVLVNSMCPGWVRTDMGGANATRSVEQGADTAVWLATLPTGGPTGGFFRDRKPIPW